MVWGMNLPSRFGEFWPDGDFKGWRASLVNFYLKQSPEVQKALLDHADGVMEAVSRYPYYVSEKMISEIGTKIALELPPTAAVQPHEAPTSFFTEKSYEKLGSLIMFNDRIIAVNEAMKSVIEGLEPGVHQFFPIDIMMPKERTFPDRYYTLVIGQYIDSFVPEQSNPEIFEEKSVKPGYYSHKHNKAGVNGLALSRAKFEGAHLWRERYLGGEWLTCFSDELKVAIEEAGLRTPPLHQMIEV